MLRPFIDGPLAVEANVPLYVYDGPMDVNIDLALHAKVYFNGKSIQDVTGLYYDAKGYGWIDQYERDEKGHIVVDRLLDEACRVRRRGRIGVVDPRMFTLEEVYLR